MKAMVLAAGLGTRLRPHTDRVPKPLFPVLGVPVIEWALRSLAAAGVTEAVVNLHHLPDAIRARLGSGERLGVRLTYSVEPEVLGTGGGLAAVRDFFLGEDAFFLHNGDVFTDWDLAPLLRLHRESGAAATLALADPPDRPDARLVEVESGRVVGIRGRPADHGGPRHVYSGVAVLGPAILDYLPAKGPSCLVERGLVPMIAAGLPVLGVVQGGLFCDIGTEERYLDLNRELLPRARDLYAFRGLRLPAHVADRSVQRIEPVLLCDGATVGPGATIGPDVVVCEGGGVAPGASVRGAVVFPGAVASGESSGLILPS